MSGAKSGVGFIVLSGVLGGLLCRDGRQTESDFGGNKWDVEFLVLQTERQAERQTQEEILCSSSSSCMCRLSQHGPRMLALSLLLRGRHLTDQKCKRTCTLASSARGEHGRSGYLFEHEFGAISVMDYGGKCLVQNFGMGFSAWTM